MKIFHKIWFGLNVIKRYKTWFSGFLDYFKIIGDGRMVHRMRGGAKYLMRTGTSDFGIINEVYIVREYHKLLDFIKKNSVVIDIGAQIGVFSVFASKIASEGRVLSFEPFDENYGMLQKNIKLNESRNVSPFKLGVAEKSGERELYISSENTGGHSFYDKEDKKIKIKTTTLQKIFEDNQISKCDFLKLDCEGAEYEILLSAPSKYLQRIKSISMEYHNNGDIQELKKHLENEKFKVVLNEELGEGMLYAWR